jgi:hypothetical protein
MFPSERLRRWLRRLAAPLLVVIICAGFYWKLGFSGQYVWFDHPDMAYIQIPRLQFIARELHAGRFPLWAPDQWLGQPLLGQTQPGPIYPLNLLVCRLPLKEGYLDPRLLNWYYVFVRALAALSLYALCRYLRRSRAASVLAGCAFAFGGFLGSIPWLDVANGAVWTPVIALFFLRAVRAARPYRDAALCGLMLGFAWLSGHHEIPLLVSYALAAGWAFAIWRTRARVLLPALLCFVVAALIGAAQLLPTAEYARLSKRWVGMPDGISWNEPIAYTVFTTYSLPVSGVLDAVVRAPARHADSTPFQGVVIVSLALLAIAAGWRRLPVRWMTALAAGALVYAFGAFTPVQGLLYSWAPLLDKARIPVRAIHLLNFALAVLAAYGFDRLLAPPRVPVQRWRRALLLIAAAVGAAWLLRPGVDDAIVTAGISALLLAVLVIAWQRAAISRPVFLSAAIFLSLAELYPAATERFASRHDPAANKFVRSLTEHHDVAAFLRSAPRPLRVTVNDRDIPANFGDWHGLPVLEGYAAGVSSNVLRIGRHTVAGQRLYGVTHHVGRAAAHPHQVELFSADSGVKVFSNPGAQPRAWVVHRTESVRQEGQLDARLADPSFDPSRTALLYRVPPPALEPCESPPVQFLSGAPNRIRLRARLNCRGLLVLADTYYPGWKARAGDREVPVLEVFGALRGVVLDQGDHTVEFVFRPASVYLGFAFFGAGLLLTLLLALQRSRRSARGVTPHATPRRTDWKAGD